MTELWPPMLLFTAVCGIVFLTTGLYRGVWRYASMNDLVAIVKAVSLSLAVFLPVTFLITRLDSLPRSWLVITWFVLIFLLGAPRMLYRVFKDQGSRQDRQSAVEGKDVYGRVSLGGRSTIKKKKTSEK